MADIKTFSPKNGDQVEITAEGIDSSECQVLIINLEGTRAQGTVKQIDGSQMSSEIQSVMGRREIFEIRVNNTSQGYKMTGCRFKNLNGHWECDYIEEM